MCYFNLRLQALELYRRKAGYLFEACYFGTIMGRAKIKCLLKIPVLQYSRPDDLIRIKIWQNWQIFHKTMTTEKLIFCLIVPYFT